MSQRIAALQDLFDRGQQKEEASDASVDQSTTTYPAPEAGAIHSLDLSSSIDVPLGDGPVSDSSHSHSPSIVQTPQRQASVAMPQPSAEATPRSTTQRDATPHREAVTHNDATPHAASMLQDESSSLSESLHASQLAQSHGALDMLDEDEDVEASQSAAGTSGHWGMQEIQRRTAAGFSIKSTLQKIEQLTAERDDLKIEVDFHRRNMSPEDVGAEVISLRQEKLGYVRRLQKMNELVKGQDQALKTVNRQVKSWEAKLADYDALVARLHEAEQRTQSHADVAHLEASLHAARQECQALMNELDALRANKIPDLEQAMAQRDTMIDDLHAELDEARSAGADTMMQQQLEEQHEMVCALQDALAAERLIVAEKEGEMDRLEGHVDAAESAAADLQRELDVCRASEASAVADAQRMHTQVAQLRRDLDEAHMRQETRESSWRDQVADYGAQIEELRAALEQQAGETQHLSGLNERLNAKLVELVNDLKAEEDAREQADTTWSQRYDTNEAQTRRALATKDALIESLEAQLAQLRHEQQQHEQLTERLQETLRTNEANARTRMEEAAARHTREMERLTDDMNDRLNVRQELQEEVTRLRAEARGMADTLQSETRMRLRTQDRLEAAQRALDEARKQEEMERARRPASPRPSSRNSDHALRTQLSERNALLTAVYDGLVHALQEDAAVSDARLLHTDFRAFHDRLTQRLKRLAHVQAQFAQRSSAMEREHLHQLADVRRNQEARWSQLDRIERSIRAAAEKQAQWRRRVLEKEDELTELHRTNRDLEHQVARLRDAPPPTPTHTTPAMLSVRIRELERRCKEADERVKRERAGAKERAARDEARIRYVLSANHRHLQTTLDCLNTLPPRADSGGRDRVVRP